MKNKIKYNFNVSEYRRMLNLEKMGNASVKYAYFYEDVVESTIETKRSKEFNKNI